MNLKRKANTMFNKINLPNYDTKKFEKFDIEQMKYNLIKPYSNIHLNKNKSFLDRMRFESFKKKNQEQKLNEIIEKNKYRLNETERQKGFKRLIEDSNRRIEQRRELSFDFNEGKNLRKSGRSNKTYNEEKWEKIYKKRFKNYEDNSKKKLEYKRRMLTERKNREEMEEVYQSKKYPSKKIMKTTQRLYNDALKRKLINDNNYSKFKYELNNDDDASNYLFKSKKSYHTYKNKNKDFEILNESAMNKSNNSFISYQKTNDIKNVKKIRQLQTESKDKASFQKYIDYKEQKHLNRNNNNIIYYEKYNYGNNYNYINNDEQNKKVEMVAKDILAEYEKELENKENDINHFEEYYENESPCFGNERKKSVISNKINIKTYADYRNIHNKNNIDNGSNNNEVNSMVNLFFNNHLNKYCY